MVFAPALRALTFPNLAGPNAGLLRDDASLGIVDEDKSKKG